MLSWLPHTKKYNIKNVHF